MKFNVIIFVFHLLLTNLISGQIACSWFGDNPNTNSEQIYSNICECKTLDFLKLKDTKIQANFFSKLDSIRKVQYPNNDQEASIMVDINTEYLNKFLTDINIDTLIINKKFENDYHFNIAPEQWTDPKKCKDRIEVIFDSKYCLFRLNVYNTFLVETDWCVESTVVYEFKILNGKIVNLFRQEIG